MSPRGKQKVEFEVTTVHLDDKIKDALAPDVTPAAAAQPAQWEVVRNACSVFDRHGAFVRTYSFELHGPDFPALANQFAAKIGGTVR